MGLHQSPRDARGDATQLEAGSPDRTGEALAQAKYEEKMEREAEDAAAGRRPGPFERLKRWFSAHF